MIGIGDHVVVRGENEEAIVTAVHPNSELEVEFLHASEAGRKRKRYSVDALDLVEGAHRSQRHHGG
jgi:hypothetical protein